MRRPLRSAKLLLTSRSWLIGFGIGIGGFALYVAALALAPLALVQSVADGGVGVLAAATARFGHRRLTRRELIGAGSRAFLQRGVGDGIAGGRFFAAGDICTKVATEGGGRTLFVIPLIAGYLLGNLAAPDRLSERRGAHGRRPRHTVHERDPDRRGNRCASRKPPGRHPRDPADHPLFLSNCRGDPARPARALTPT